MSDPTGCILGPGVIETASGKPFSVLDHKPDDIKAEDIAHSLSLICRYAGHCRFFYSVAKHSVLVMHEIGRRFPGDTELQLAALFHDGSEAYLADLPRPVKLLVPEYQNIERRVQSAIFTWLELDLSDEHHHEIKAADNAVLAAEAPVLMKSRGAWWGIDNIEPAELPITKSEPHEDRERFLFWYERLSEWRRK